MQEWANVMLAANVLIDRSTRPLTYLLQAQTLLRRTDLCTEECCYRQERQLLLQSKVSSVCLTRRCVIGCFDRQKRMEMLDIFGAEPAQRDVHL